MNKKLLAFFILYTFHFLLSAQAQTVTIGKQVWMSENLNVEKFRNGDAIPEAKTAEEWKKAGEEGKPAWCYYENRSIQDDPENGEKYGKLYNWYAVNDPRGLAPKGWHIPSDDEWTILANFLGGAKVAGDKMQSKTGWNDGGNGSNSSGLSGLPGGNRYYHGPFTNIGLYGFWWSSTEDNTSNAWLRFLSYNNGSVGRYSSGKPNGFSVRCVRD
ncbi:MAG: hypothetical protein FGM46_10580 [Ferruginibacter sp.]|nr:hypothetical protein [Ferruginibacter sp.]